MTGFGYAPAPLSDEPLSHWLAKVAADAGVSTAALLNHHGLNYVRTNPTKDFTCSQVDHLADLTGFPAQVLLQMTTHRWAKLGLNADPRAKPNKGAAWSMSTVERACLDCLAERNGTPRIQWGLIWSFACTKHEKLLEPSTRGSDPYRLSTSLGATALELQDVIDQLLDTTRETVETLGRNQPGWAYLADLGALARCAITTPTPEELGRLVERATAETWEELIDQFPTHPSDAKPPVRLAAAASSPALTAAALVLADEALRQPTTTLAATTLEWMATGARNELRDHAAQRGITFALWQTLATKQKTQNRAAYLKRFALTRRNQTGVLIPPLTSAALPSRIWSTVLAEDVTRPLELQAFSTSAALLMTASNRRTNDVLEALGLTHLRKQIQADWADALGVGDTADKIHSHLIELHQALTAGHIPINYDRRRRTFPAPEPLGTRHRNQLLAALDQPDHKHLVRHAAWFIHELLTGNDFLISEQVTHMHGLHRQQYRHRRALWNSTQPAVFYELAELRLYRNNINEPVTWQPRHENGHWITPRDDGRRHLNFWATTNRPLRGPGRVATDPGYGLDAVVAHALHGNGPSAEQALRLLDRFEAAAQAPTFTAAASALGISQAALSVSMQDLERLVAKPLFDRTLKRATLAFDGHRLLRTLRTERAREARH